MDFRYVRIPPWIEGRRSTGAWSVAAAAEAIVGFAVVSTTAAAVIAIVASAIRPAARVAPVAIRVVPVAATRMPRVGDRYRHARAAYQQERRYDASTYQEALVRSRHDTSSRKWQRPADVMRIAFLHAEVEI